MSEFTQVLERIRHGDAKAADELLPIIYNDLRQLAAAKLANESAGHTLQATALVHEAWLRLGGPDPVLTWENRRHFFAAAGLAMRRILIESARRKQAQKRGALFERVPLESVDIPLPLPEERLLALDEALSHLHAVRPEASEIVHLCFFAGLTQAQAAQELGVSLATAERLWAFARAWLFREINAEQTNRSSR
jgi:RNA polymerase sigma factor (TIGR02999 family)